MKDWRQKLAKLDAWVAIWLAVFFGCSIFAVVTWVGIIGYTYAKGTWPEPISVKQIDLQTSDIDLKSRIKILETRVNHREYIRKCK